MKYINNSMGYIANGLLAIAIVLSLPATVLAQQGEPLHIGFAAQVERTVEGQIGEADFVPVQIDDDIFFNEIITTEPDAIAVMSFRDGSTLEIGPNSAVTIDEFVFNPVEGVKTQTMSVLVGSFRFVSGMAMPNQTVTINTPTATLGIRGSVANGVVGANGDTAAVPTNGTLTMQSRLSQVSNGQPGTGIESATLLPGEPGITRATSNTVVTGPTINSVGRQVVSTTTQTFGVRVNTPTVTAQRRARDAVANQTPTATQEQANAAAQPSQARLNAQTTALNARQDQTLDALGVDSVTTLENSGVLGTTQLSGEQQNTVNSLNETTAALENLLNNAIVEGEIASQNNHVQGTTNVITGLSQSGNVQAVTAATGNASQADPNQAAPAVGAAAANLNNVDANAMTGVLQSAVNGLQAGGSEVNGNVVGNLTATAINNMNPATQQSIGNQVAANITSNFAASNPNEAANLASTLTSQLTGAASNIASNATQNLATQIPSQANAINTAANNAAATNLASLASTAAGTTQFQPTANTLATTNASSGPAIANTAAATNTPVVASGTVNSGVPIISVPEPTTIHGL